MSWFARRVFGWVPVAMLSTVPSMIMAQPAWVVIGKSGDVELSKPARIGGMTLQPSHYRLQHEERNGDHVLIVKKRDAEWRSGRSYAVGAGTEVVRVPCQLVFLDKTVSDTAVYFQRQPDGATNVTQIRIRGERSGHILALEPKTP